MVQKVRQIHNEDGDSLARVQYDGGEYPIFLSLGVGSHMGTSLSLRQAVRLCQVIQQTINEAINESETQS